MTERAAKARDEFAECKQAYEERLRQAMPEIEEARRKRDESGKDVSPELLAKYKNLRQHKLCLRQNWMVQNVQAAIWNCPARWPSRFPAEKRLWNAKTAQGCFYVE